MGCKIWNCNGNEFYVGAKVKVVRREETDAEDGMGKGVAWFNAWVDSMDNYIGKEFTIVEIGEQGAEFKEDAPDGFGFPLSCLERV